MASSDVHDPVDPDPKMSEASSEENESEQGSEDDDMPIAVVVSESKPKPTPKKSPGKSPKSKIQAKGDNGRAVSKSKGKSPTKGSAKPAKKKHAPYPVKKPMSAYLHFCKALREHMPQGATVPSDEAPTLPDPSLPLDDQLARTFEFVAHKLKNVVPGRQTMTELGQLWPNIPTAVKAHFQQMQDQQREQWLKQMEELGGDSAERAAKIRNPKRKTASSAQASASNGDTPTPKEPQDDAPSKKLKPSAATHVPPSPERAANDIPKQRPVAMQSLIPNARIRKIMAMDTTATGISKEAGLLTTKATEMFVGWLADRVHGVGLYEKQHRPSRCLITPEVFDTTLKSTPELRFLRATLSAVDLAAAEEALERRPVEDDKDEPDSGDDEDDAPIAELVDKDSDKES